MSHLTLDARAILSYLNELGYRNVSAEQLREFIKDLRKLIKYEERLGANAQKDDYFEALFRRTTASYRAKADKENAAKTDAAVIPEKSSAPKQRVRKMSTTQVDCTSVTTFKRHHQSESSQMQQQRRPLGESNRGAFEFSSRGSTDLPNGKSLMKKKTTMVMHRNGYDNEAEMEIGTHAEARIKRKLKEDNKEPTWKAQMPAFDAIPRSRSRSTARGRRTQSPLTVAATTPAIAAAPPSAAGNKENAPRSQSSERYNTDRRTYTVRSTGGGTMVPQLRSKSRGNRSGASDPVKLYHYYQREWKHFQNQIPGEQTRADIRWQIRQKLLDPK